MSGSPLAAFSQAPDPEFFKAQTLESQGKNDEALAIYSRLYNEKKTDVYFFKLVMLCERIGNFKTMGEISRDRLSINPHELSAINYLSRSLYGQGKNSEGQRVLMESFGDKWDDSVKIRNAASEFMNRNDLVSALSVYLTAREKTGNKSIYSFELAQIYRVQMNYSQAIREYLKTLENQPASYNNIDLLLKAALDAKADTKSLLTPLIEYQKMKPANLPVARLISDLNYRLGDYEGAYKSLLDSAVPAKNPTDLWNMAERLNEEGHTREAILAYSDFYRYFKAGQNGKNSLLRCAALRAKKGDSEGAEKDYLTLAADFPGTVEESLASLRIMELSSKETGTGLISNLQAFTALPLDQSVACEANLFLGQTCLRQGKTEDAEKALNEARLKARSKNEVYDVTSTMALVHFFTDAYDLMA
ncbi:MAG: tetratricopeptide repeat protein, partial [Candidatus Latescibacterota bacterium]